MRSARKFSRFVQTIVCSMCGRKARPDQIDHLCNQCFDLASWDNQFNDNGTRPNAAAAHWAETQLAKITHLGGSAQKVRDFCRFLFAPDLSLPEEGI